MILPLHVSPAAFDAGCRWRWSVRGFLRGYQLKGLRARFKKGEASALVVASAGPGRRGKATGREWSARRSHAALEGVLRL